jgi:hypothetical protein
MTTATIKDAFKLFMDGSIALAQVEANGIKVDVDYLDRAIKETTEKVSALEEKLRADRDVFIPWRRRYGNRLNLGSRQQLAEVLVQDLEFDVKERTEKTGRAKMSKNVLEGIDRPFVKAFLRMESLKKVLNTYLVALKREVVNGYFHPNFNIAHARTYRSSSGSDKASGQSGRDLNIQNLPVRDDEQSDIVRRCFIAREGHQLIELDFKVLEVIVGVCYHKDRNMIRYLNSKDSDMHRDGACRAFMLEPSQVSKECRYGAKNRLIFPLFFGSYYVDCAKNLWEWMDRAKLRLRNPEDGKNDSTGPLIVNHLRRKGVYELGACDPEHEPKKGTFEYHLREVERYVWNVMFPEYRDWKKSFYEQYLQRGWFESYTGCRFFGEYRRNQVVNYGIQCLAGDSRVLTSDGLIPIKDLVSVSCRVWTGFKWADAIGLKGSKNRRAIVYLNSGLTIRCDTNHKFKNEDDQWIPFQDLKEGDWIALPNTGRVVEASPDIGWWFIFGFILGDGCISASTRRDHVDIVVGRKKKGILLRIKEFLITQKFEENVYGGLHWSVIKPKSDRHAEQYKLRIGGNRFVSIMEKCGFVFGWTAHTKRLPASLWTASAQEQRDFMEGLWLSDGSRGKHTNRYLHMCNKRLLNDIQILIAPLGFDSRLCRTTAGYLLRVSIRKFWAKAFRRFPAAAVVRQVKSVCKPNGYDNQCQYVGDVRVFSKSRKGVDATHYSAERVIEKNSENPQVYRYDRVMSISLLDKEEITYTMSVNDSLHQFVADGVIHKNSSAFHCLLWCLIRLQNWLNRNRMRSKIVGQVHDSMLVDAHISEVGAVIAKAKKIMSEELPREWKWIIVPLSVEVEVSSPGKSWKDKKPLE